MSRDFSSQESVFRAVQNQNLYRSHVALNNYIASAKNSLDYVQRLGVMCRLQVHSGCVNTVCWNSTGDYLLSGSDDQCVAITNPHSQEVLLKYKTAHRANIFSARFMPQSNDQAIVSCSGDGIVLHTELLAPYIRRKRIPLYGTSGRSNNTVPPIYEHTENETKLSFFNCHKSGTTYEVLTVPSEPRSFMSCGEDGTVRLFDLRQISSCHKTCCKDNILIFSPSAVSAMDLSPISNHYIAVGSSDAIVRIYDRRYLSVIDFSDSSIPTAERHTRPVKAYPIPLNTNRHYRVTCVKYSPEESEMLVSYSSEYLYLFDLKHEGADVNELCKKIPNDDSGRSIPPPLYSAEQVTRRLRLRGDWSDTGPDARPENNSNGQVEIGQVRPQLQANIMSRMTEVISRLLNDPRTRLGLSGQAHELNRENQASLLAAFSRDNDEEAVPSSSAAVSWRRAAVRLQNSRIEALPPSIGLHRADLRLQHSSNGNTVSTQEMNSPSTTTPSISRDAPFFRENLEVLPSSSAVGLGTADLRLQDSTIGNTVSRQEINRPSATIPGNSRDAGTNGRAKITEATINDYIQRRRASVNPASNSTATQLQDEAAEIEELAGLDMQSHAMVFDYLRMKYVGHRNARTMIKEANFWGNNYVMSGSDCGHIFIWDRRTGNLVMLMQGDQHVVNCLQPHPVLPYLASSGIDYDFKIWAPILKEPNFDRVEAEDLMKRNAVMLEQTKDTITVPAAFMIRLLACIHSLRNRERILNSENHNSPNTNQNVTNDTEAVGNEENQHDSAENVNNDNTDNSSDNNRPAN